MPSEWSLLVAAPPSYVNFGPVGLSNLFQATPRAPGQTPPEWPPYHVSCGTRANNARGKEACHRPRVYGTPGNRPQGWWETALGTASAPLSSAGATTATLGQWRRTPSNLMSSQSSCQRYSSQTKDGNNSNPSSCCNCKCLELLKQVEALEAALKKMSKEALAAARTSMSSARTSSDIQSTTAEKHARREPLQKTPDSARKEDQVLKGVMKGTLYGQNLEGFRFCYYMVGSLPESATKHDLQFLARMDKLRKYPNYLKNKGYMPTTIRNMALNLVSLYKHVKNVFLEESRLKVEDIDRVLYELTRLQAEIRRELAYENRRLRMKALMCKKSKAKAKHKSKVCDEQEACYSLSSESSEDRDKPVYDDEPESSSPSSSSSEELSIRSQGPASSPAQEEALSPLPSRSPRPTLCRQ
ncbi:hypothetical protein D5F01_LYC11209 [Larimichthys crocea]|uniref:Uncharacterized protein n=1 Tax=Larimichthys crocea TaxID=215358 RepID=A0A6G0IDS8_LARCR|nr:hypothetical protein D5F01_LYC11209 [Larimichthys crocea]